MKKATLAALAVMAIVTLAVWAADVSGTWEMSRPGRREKSLGRGP